MTIFVEAPSFEELERRLRERATESAGEIEERLDARARAARAGGRVRPRDRERRRRARRRTSSRRSSRRRSRAAGTMSRPMIHPRIDELLDNVDSRYALVIVAAKRARQINNYHHQLGEGTFDDFPPPLVESRSKNYLTMALEEIAEGKIKYDYTRASASLHARRHNARMARVLLGVTGGIAAYKACELARLLVARGHEVVPLLTPRRRAVRDAARPSRRSRAGRADGDLYPHLTRADLLVVAPLTANTLAKLAHGLADNVLTEAALAHRGPVLVAPAMNPRMWAHPATQANARAAARARRRAVGPDEGELGRGRGGRGADGRAARRSSRASRSCSARATARCAGKRVLVTAGGTREPLDAVRFLGNRSSGRMGVALADGGAAARRRRDARSPRTSPCRRPAGVEVVETPTAADLAREALARGRRRRRPDGRRGRRLPARRSRRRQAAEGRRAVDARARADRRRPRRARRAPRERPGARRLRRRRRARAASSARAGSSRDKNVDLVRLQRRITRRHRLRRRRQRGRRSSTRDGERRVAKAPKERDRRGDPRRGRAPAERMRWTSRRQRPAAQAVAARASIARASPTNLARVVHAPDETLRLVRPLPRQRGAPDHRGLPGRGEDDAREGARALARLLVLAAPVHARPAAVGRHRRQRLQPALERVRVPAGPGVREPAARRRDQPRLAEDAGRAARVHAGEPGHDRRRHLRARRGRSWSWRRRTRSSTRARTRCPRRSSTASRCGSRSATRRSPTRRGCSTEQTSEPPLETLEPVATGDEVLAAIERGEARSSSRRASTATSSRCCGTRAPTRGSTSAPARAPASRCCASPRRGRSPTGRDYVLPDDVKAVAAAVLAHRLILAPEARSAGLAPRRARPRGRREDAGPGLEPC